MLAAYPPASATMNATVLGVMASASASISPNGTILKPGANGPNPPRERGILFQQIVNIGKGPAVDPSADPADPKLRRPGSTAPASVGMKLRDLPDMDFKALNDLAAKSPTRTCKAHGLAGLRIFLPLFTSP